MGHALFLPTVRGEGETKLQELLRLLLTSSWQKRENPQAHPRLMAAAQAKAEDMAARGYYAHTAPTGETANEQARLFYPLPDGYAKVGNNVESLNIGRNIPAAIILSWLNSPHHHDHVTGDDSFYAKQTAVGVGVAKNKESRWLWVFLSAPSLTS